LKIVQAAVLTHETHEKQEGEISAVSAISALIEHELNAKLAKPAKQHLKTTVPERRRWTVT
jgi:hypothetical protein